MIIDCDTCEVRGAACGDCVVTFFTIGMRPQTVEIDEDQTAAMAALAEGGLVPPLRLVREPRAG
jgi:hypothetical protein